MRIACYGFVERDAGSVASANFLLLEEMLRRGHEVHFYAIRNFVHPKQLFSYPNFHYHGVLIEDSLRLRRRMKWAGEIVGRLVGNLSYSAHLRAIRNLVSEHHAHRPFDVLLFLGVGAEFAVGGLPTVGWTQGPPQTEWEAIRRLRPTIIRICGPGLYFKLKLFYAHKLKGARRELDVSDLIIALSSWSREKFVEFGVPGEQVEILAYPMDLQLFTPEGPERRLGARKRFLWLGRIDPRKRLDLMLDAFKLLAEERDDIELDIIGRLNYAPQYKTLIDSFPYPDRVRFSEGIPRAKVPALLRSSVAVVQPSEYENFGSSVAEALCCGTPVVIGPTNGTGDFVGEGAFHFDSYTPESLAEALRRCLAALEQDEAAVVARARAAAEAHFDVARVVTDLEEILRATVSLHA